jgi:hypothetical protein
MQRLSLIPENQRVDLMKAEAEARKFEAQAIIETEKTKQAQFFTPRKSQSESAIGMMHVALLPHGTAKP